IVVSHYFSLRNRFFHQTIDCARTETRYRRERQFIAAVTRRAGRHAGNQYALAEHRWCVVDLVIVQ
ncbi:TPA: hypothetical protein ACNTXO_005024, partial [Escherichia coli]